MAIEFPIRISGQEDEEYMFSTLDKLREWLEEERHTWSFLLADKQFGNQLFGNADNTMRNLVSSISQLEASPGNAQLESQVSSGITSVERLIKIGNFVPSRTDFGKYILEVAKDDPESAVDTMRVGAVPRHQGIPSDAGAQDGAFLLALYRHGLGKRSLQASKASFSKVLSEIQLSLDDFKIAKDERLDGLDQAIASREEAANRGASTMASILRKQRANLRNEQFQYISQSKNKVEEFLSETKARISEFEEFYEAKVSLQGPVAYWKSKRAWHRCGTVIAALAFAIYCTVCIRIFLGYLGTFSDGFTGFLTFWKDAQLGALGAFALVIALAVVFARILYRLFASQLHLWNDCSERVTMTQTYLALAENGHAKEEFLGSLLNRLFAPASDGVVKDDFGSVGPIDYIGSRLGR